MRSVVRVTDEELVAYLDGVLDPLRRREIDAELARDGRLRARLDGLDVDTDAIRAAFDAVAVAAPVGTLREGCDRDARPPDRRNDRRWLGIAAALVLGLGLGYAIGSDAGDRRAGVSSEAADKTWHAAVADYQALYTGATLAFVTEDAARQRAEVAVVAAKLGLPIGLEALAVPELRYKRAQLLAFMGQPLAQFVYLDPTGIPVALCAIRTGDADSPIRTGRFHDMAAAFWSRDGYGFIVIGRTEAAAIGRAAAALAPQMPEKG
jgi:anti-sigma factor RsiW